MSTSTTVIQTRISLDDRNQAELISSQLGLSLNDVFRIVIKSMILNRAIPVTLSLPKDERLPTPAEKLTLDNHKDNPNLLGVEESAKFLAELREYANSD